MLSKKITFLGAPIPNAYGPLPKGAAFLSRPDIKATGLAVAFSAVAAEILSPGSNFALAEATTTLILNAIDIIGWSWMEQLVLSKRISPTVQKEKCIDTAPDPKLPSNLDVWELQARHMVRYYKFMGITMFALKGYNIITAAQTNPIHAMNIALGSGALAARMISGVQRWNNVLNSKWRISDKGPTPEPVKKTSTQLRHAAIGVMRNAL